MQKKVMALAVAGALALPAVAMAQSSVQLSGRATMEYGWAEQGTNRPSTDIADNPGGSNVRFRGQENLGGGLSAWFQCESSADLRGTDHDAFCTRNSAVGFRGGFGNIYAGKWDTPMKRAIGQGWVGGEQTGILGMSFMAFGGSGGADATASNDGAQRQRWSRRDSNIIYYETPNMSGFQVLAAITHGADATEVTNAQHNQKPRVMSIAGTYVNGPLAIGLGYEVHKDFGKYPTGVATQDLDDDAWGIGASYTFGPVTLGAAYVDADYETGPGQETKKKLFTIGADWRLAGPHMLSIQYVKADDSDGNGGTIGGTANGAVTGCRVGAVVNCSETGGQALSLGYTYRFSKRTNIRLGYIRVANDDRTNAYKLSGGKAENGDTLDGYAVLVKHDF